MFPQTVSLPIFDIWLFISLPPDSEPLLLKKKKDPTGCNNCWATTKRTKILRLFSSSSLFYIQFKKRFKRSKGEDFYKNLTIEREKSVRKAMEMASLRWSIQRRYLVLQTRWPWQCSSTLCLVGHCKGRGSQTDGQRTTTANKNLSALISAYCRSSLYYKTTFFPISLTTHTPYYSIVVSTTWAL